MKPICNFAALTLMLCAFSEHGFATSGNNLVRGVVGPVQSDGDWSNYSAINLIPGSALFQASSSTTVFYMGFTGGTEADIGNMVVYTTPRGSLTISAVTPVTLSGISHPSIDIGSTTVCPTAPSTATPCVVRLDPTSLTLSPTSDYYLVVYFTSGTNNAAIGAANPSANQTSLAGAFFGGTDYTNLAVGQSIPNNAATGGPNFLMYVMSN